MITTAAPTGGRNSMRKNRLLITVAALGTAASVAGLAAPVMAAPAINPDVAFSCPTNWLSGSPVTFTVKTTGIHIRNNPAPNATILYPIAKGASFRSSWSADGFSFACISPSMGGQRWVLGWDVSNNNHVGWVGRNYLK